MHDVQYVWSTLGVVGFGRQWITAAWWNRHLQCVQQSPSIGTQLHREKHHHGSTSLHRHDHHQWHASNKQFHIHKNSMQNQNLCKFLSKKNKRWWYSSQNDGCSRGKTKCRYLLMHSLTWTQFGGFLAFFSGPQRLNYKLSECRKTAGNWQVGFNL